MKTQNEGRICPLAGAITRTIMDFRPENRPFGGTAGKSAGLFVDKT
ncbi:MAG: hypothetical protein JSU70_07530 [Phycisphaerales bacterium]|nr:MAG: hypothetical protein JSU70_07530 [Phycisphaerales bacterium]